MHKRGTHTIAYRGHGTLINSDIARIFVYLNEYEHEGLDRSRGNERDPTTCLIYLGGGIISCQSNTHKTSSAGQLGEILVYFGKRERGGFHTTTDHTHQPTTMGYYSLIPAKRQSIEQRRGNAMRSTETERESFFFFLSDFSEFFLRFFSFLLIFFPFEGFFLRVELHSRSAAGDIYIHIDMFCFVLFIEIKSLYLQSESPSSTTKPEEN